jgi:hypothetical protein
MQESTPALEQEIADLERRLQEKKAALGQAEGEQDFDKETVHEVVGNKIQEHAPEFKPRPFSGQSSGSVAPVGGTNDERSYLLPELKDLIQNLVNITFGKSLSEAVSAAKGSNNPAVMDAFHDVLTDQMYDILVERKQLAKVK